MKKIFKICYVSSLVAYGIDCLIITPYALLNYPVKEVGLILGWLYLEVGIFAFPLFYLIFAIASLWFFRALEKVTSKLPKISQWLTALTPTLCFCYLMGWTINHNLKVIFSFH